MPQWLRLPLQARRYATEAARTRFAPSPTGLLHLGSLRTALYSYLLARATGGTFILRIEDTDTKRTVPGAIDRICQSLQAFGLAWDEGPYLQSERIPLYGSHAEQLIRSGKAYRCFCSHDRIEDLRSRIRYGSFYDRKCASLSYEESNERAQQGDAFVVRLKMPQRQYSVSDLVLGDVRFGDPLVSRNANGLEVFADPVLLKSNSYPTYHLANVVDDHAMKVSHVIRGEEWLPSTPTHLALYDAFGWTPPQFAHVPLLVDADGSKLSKRKGSAFVDTYLDEGYSPEAVLNFVALLGWAPQVVDELKPILTLSEMAEKFSINGLTKGAVQVNYHKLDFLSNKHFCQALNTESGLRANVADAVPICRSLSPDDLGHWDDNALEEYLRKVLPLIAERWHRMSDLKNEFAYLFKLPKFESTGFLKLKDDSKTIELLKTIFGPQGVESLETWKGQDIKAAIERLASRKGPLLRALRLVMTDQPAGPPLYPMMEVMGKQMCLKRWHTAEKALQNLDTRPE